MISMSASDLLRLETEYHVINDSVEVRALVGDAGKYNKEMPYNTSAALIIFTIRPENATSVVSTLRDALTKIEEFAARVESEKKAAEICEGDYHSKKCFTGELEGLCPVFEAEKDAEELSLT